MRAIFENGIGCDRAIVLDGDKLVEALLELPGIRAGDVWRARLIDAYGSRGVVDLSGPIKLPLLPPGAHEGGWITVEVLREPIPEPDRLRAAKIRAVDPTRFPEPAAHQRLRSGPDLRARLLARGLAVQDAPATGQDALEAAGWSEALEEARTGEIAFPGGRLLIERTAAFEVIDVDGHLAAADLALAAARAVGETVRRLDLSGAIVVDFPTPGDPVARRAADAALEAALPRPFERTAMNGFGLVQIVRPKLRPSLIDHCQAKPVEAATLALLRRAGRTGGAGPMIVTAAPPVAARLSARPKLLAELARRTGRAAELRADAALPIWGGHVQA